MSKFDLSQSARNVVSVATNTRGAVIHAYAKYLKAATEYGTSVDAANTELLAQDSGQAVGSKATLALYAQVIKSADSLALNSADDYGVLYTSIVRMRKVKGYDLTATLAPVVALPQTERRAALAKIKGDAIVTRESVAANTPAKKTTKKSSAKPTADRVLELLTNARDLMRDTKASFTPEQFEALMTITEDIQNRI